MFELSNLKISLGHLLSEIGSTDNILVGLAVNLGLAVLGVLFWWLASDPVSYVGIIWAIINVLGVVKWVMNG